MNPPVGEDSADVKRSLDKINSSWDWRWLWPSLRKIAVGSCLSNTLAIRVEYEKSYRPKNLEWKNGALSGSYQIEEVLRPAEALS